MRAGQGKGGREASGAYSGSLGAGVAERKV
mgnify:CR=1 FL=1